MSLRRKITILDTALKAGILRTVPPLYPLLGIEPASCNIMITNKCNLRCVMCKQWKMQEQGELTVPEWKNILADLRRNGIREAHFTGGEPLIRKDALLDLVRYCRGLGMSCGMTTNGTMLGRSTLSSLVESGVSTLALSMDAVGDKYDAIRGVPGSFKAVGECAKLVAGMRRSGKLAAYINFVLMKETIDKFDDVKRFADELRLPVGVCLLDRSSLQFGTDENKNVFWINRRDDFLRLEGLMAKFYRIITASPSTLLMNFAMVDFVRAYFEDPRQERIPCVSSQDRIIIDPSGNLFGGCLSMGSFGNLTKNSFGRLRREERYRRAKQDMFYKKCAGCSCGYQFNILCSIGLSVRSFVRKAAWSSAAAFRGVR